MQILRSRFAQSTFVHALALLVVSGSLLLTAVHPLTFGAMPDTADGLLHLYRLVALDNAIQHGDLWPRYVPGLLFGYGAPVFNYYAPLSLYPSEVLHLLGLSFLDAFIVGLIIYVFIGATGAYQLGKVWSASKGSSWEGQVTGIATAVAYAYAPYTLYNLPRRGAVAEAAALALLPWVLWAFWRLVTHGRRRDFVLAVGLYALFIPIHNITTLQGTALLVACCFYLWWINDDPRRAFVRLGLAGLLALGLTSFFWLPALGEAGYAHLERAIGPASADFHNNFQSLGETFSLPLTADLTQLHPPVPRALGWPQVILGLAGFGLTLWPGTRDNKHQKGLRGRLVLAFVLLLTFIFLTTRASTIIWEAVPLLGFIQLPWRLLGIASLLLAILVGAGVARIGERFPWQTGRAAWIGLCAVVMILYAMPWLYVLYLPQPRAETIVDVQNFERGTGWLATGSLGEYLPYWTTELPDQNRLIGLYARDNVIPRLQPAPGVTVNAAEWGPTSAALDLTVEDDTLLVFDWLYFPGWWARLDGEETTLTPTRPQGFVGVEVPAGDLTLELGFGPTPLRLGSMIASGVFVLALIGVLFVRPIWPTTIEAGAVLPVIDGRVLIAAVLAGIVVFAGKLFLIDNLETPIKRARFAHGVEAGLQTPVLASYGGQITLLGFDQPHLEVMSGQSADFVLYWQLAGDMVEENYSTVVYLRDAASNVVAQTGSQHPGDYPTSDWVPGFYVQERLKLDVPPATPPDAYTVHVALYSHLAKRNLDTFDVGGNPLGVTVEVATLNIVRPRRPAQVDDLDIGVRLDAHLTDALTLIGSHAPPVSSEVGQPFPVVWYWRAQTQPVEDYGVRLVWLDRVGVAGTLPVVSPVVGYPTSQWEKHDVWKGLYLMHAPGGLEAGRYNVAVQLVDPAGNPVGDPVIIGQTRVSTPPRAFNAPEMGVLADTAWEGGILLLGYDLPQERVSRRGALDLVLYWQPGEEIDTGLTVFVHLIDDEGHIVAQRDSIPVNGSRPTTGWAPGEVITDPYTLFIGEDIPPGEYRLRVGWYDARTGQRVRLAGGADFWLLPQVIQVAGS